MSEYKVSHKLSYRYMLIKKLVQTVEEEEGPGVFLFARQKTTGGTGVAASGGKSPFSAVFVFVGSDRDRFEPMFNFQKICYFAFKKGAYFLYFCFISGTKEIIGCF